MGLLLPAYRKAVVDAVSAEISSNTGYYYAFAANASPTTGSTSPATDDDYSSTFTMDWQMLFGKRLSNTNILPVINNVSWANGTVYTQYDDNATDMADAMFYVLTQPVVNGPFNVYKCVYNNSGAPSTIVPSLVQAATFTTADGYMWRYLTTITYADYQNFNTDGYVPIYPNTSIVSTANQYSGVDVVVTTDSGSGYSATTNGVVAAVINSTMIQIQSNTSSPFNDTYTLSGIYLKNSLASTSQLNYISRYVANSSGNWVFLASPANTFNITPSVTTYLITPRVIFTSDGSSSPQGYATIDSSGNGVINVVIIDPGSYVTWANVSIVANGLYGSGATAYAIVPPAGGHGANPEVELFVRGLGVSFSFSNTESGTIPTGISYSSMGVLKNPCSLQAGGGKGTPYTNTTFSQLVTGTVSPSKTFAVGSDVTGNTSGATGVVALSNSTTLWLSGSQVFANNEYVTDGSNTTVFTINTTGDIYTADQRPLYYNNISTVTRSNTQTEAFRLVILI